MRSNCFLATVVECRQRADDIFRLSLRTDQPFNAKPGQFVSLETLCRDKMWRRPFSIYDQLADGRNFSVCFKVAGDNTRHYASLKPGDRISVLGPLGNPITINQGGENQILVAGGIGMAGLAFLAAALKSQGNGSIFLYGAKRQREVFDAYMLNNICRRVEVATEAENHLLATDLLRKELSSSRCYDGDNTEIIACGPKDMLEKVSEIAMKHNIPCQVSMETLMACGVGSCQGCDVPKIGGGFFSLCKEGPALPGDLVDWEKLRRPSMIVQAEKRRPIEEINMQVTLIGQNGLNLVLPSPIILDSGCFEAEAATDGPVDLTYVGAVSGKGTTALPKDGNPWPRICEIPSGMMNSIGLKNVGLEVFIKDKLPNLKVLGKTVIANISGDTAEEFAYMAAELEKAGVKAICLNISCPNIKKGGRIFSLLAEDTFEVVRKVRQRVTEKVFLFVKLSPMADVVKVALAAEQAGADALWLSNTFLGMKIDLATRRPAIGNVFAGMSGPGEMHQNVRLVYLVCQQVRIPVVASKGIESGADAAEYIIAGAQAVAIGTGLFHNPSVATKVYMELREIVAAYSMSDIKELVGSLIL